MSCSSSACAAAYLHKPCLARNLPRAAGIQGALFADRITMSLSLYLSFNIALLLTHQCFTVNNFQVRGRWISACQTCRVDSCSTFHSMESSTLENLCAEIWSGFTPAARRSPSPQVSATACKLLTASYKAWNELTDVSCLGVKEWVAQPGLLCV